MAKYAAAEPGQGVDSGAHARGQRSTAEYGLASLLTASGGRIARSAGR